MSRGKENNAGDAKVWSVDDDTTLWDQLQSEVPAPKLAKSPKVAALVAKLSASADEIVARYGELVDISGPARLRLDILKRVVLLRHGHCAALKPAVEYLRHTPQRRLPRALGWNGNLIHDLPVQVGYPHP